MSLLEFPIVFLLLFLTSVSESVSNSNRQQFVKIYEYSSCEEPTLLETVVQTNWISFVLNDFLDSEVYLLINGLWRIDGNLHYGYGFVADADAETSRNSSCSLFPVDKPNVRFERIGDETQNLDGLRLFPSENLVNGGSPPPALIKKNLTSWNNHANKCFKSFFFIGNVSWGVYSERDYQGEESCLRPFPNVVEQGYGISYAVCYDVKLGSARTWCRDDEESGGGDGGTTTMSTTIEDVNVTTTTGRTAMSSTSTSTSGGSTPTFSFSTTQELTTGPIPTEDGGGSDTQSPSPFPTMETDTTTTTTENCDDSPGTSTDATATAITTTEVGGSNVDMTGCAFRPFASNIVFIVLLVTATATAGRSI